MFKNSFSLLFFVGFLFFGGNVLFAQDRTKLESEKARIEQEIKKLNNDLLSTQKNKTASRNQLVLIKKKIQEREKLIKNINSQITILDSEIDSTQKGIEELHVQITDLKAEYAKIIRMLYKQKDKNTDLVLLFNSQDFNQAYQRLKFFKEYNSYRKAQAEQIREKETGLSLKNNELEHQKTEQAKLLAEEEQQKQKLSREQKQTQNSITKIQGQEKKIAADIKQKQERRRKLQQQIDRIIAEEVRKRQAEKLAREKKAAEEAAKARSAAGKEESTSSKDKEDIKPKVIPTEKYTMASTPEEVELSNNFIKNKGKLPWPTEKAAISIPYGEYTHAETHGKNTSYGISIVTTKNTTARSVFDGVVTAIATDPYVNQQLVMVNHGEFITVYTNLENLTVSRGTRVKTKQAIGTVHTDTEGKTEMQFQIWKAGSTVNPVLWLAPLRK